MKSLTESVINELRLSKASTGRKLEYKTFSELKEGDYLFRGYYNVWIQDYFVEVFSFSKLVDPFGSQVLYLDDDPKKTIKADTDILCLNTETNHKTRLKVAKNETMVSYGPEIDAIHYFSNIKVLQEYLEKKHQKLTSNCQAQLKELGIL